MFVALHSLETKNWRKSVIESLINWGFFYSKEIHITEIWSFKEKSKIYNYTVISNWA